MPRVLIVSASMGAGHDTAAGVLAGRLRARGATVDVVDVLALPRLRQGAALRAFYRGMVGRTPALYDGVMRAWSRHPGFFERVTAWGAGGYERPLLRRALSDRADVVVTTYNLAAAMVGRLRAAGRLQAAAVSYVTDPGPHPYWVAGGVDLHLAPLPQTAAELASLGAARVQVVAPLVERPAPGTADPASARRHWGLPAAQRVALVNGGSWGVGSTAATAAALARGGILPLVLCGRSTRLAAAVDEVGGARAVGWTEDVPGLLAAADVLVDNAGGTTCWEALAAGRPVVLYRPIPGHGRINAATLADAGLACWARDAADLVRAAGTLALPEAAATVFAQPDAAEQVARLW